MWNEAGTILGAAAQGLNSVMGLTSANANILASFREDVAGSLTPNVFESRVEPT